MNSYTVEKIAIKDELLKVQIGNEETQTDFVIYAADFWNLGIRQDDVIDQEQYQQLVRLHGYCHGYRQCLKKLGYRDHSVAEIRELLQQQKGLDDDQREAILQQLQTAHLLDDSRLAANSFDYDGGRLIGRRKTAYDLEKRGVEREIIQQQLSQSDDDTEREHCKARADIIVKSIRGRSKRETMSMLRQKLLNAGYETEIINDIMTAVQLPEDDQAERASLRDTLEKALRHYQPHNKGYQLRQKLYAHAARKGYSSDMIKEVLTELEVNQDENQ